MEISILKKEDKPILKKWLLTFLIDHIDWWCNCYDLAWDKSRIEKHISSNCLVQNSLEKLFNSKDSEKDFIRTIRINNTIEGIVHAKVEKDSFVSFNTGYIQWIWVDKNKRGLGYAQKLIAEVQNWISKKDVHGLELFVNSPNSPAIALYKKFGFEVSDFQMLASKIKFCDKKIPTN